MLIALEKSTKAWVYNIIDEQNLNKGNIPSILDKEALHLMQFQEQQMIYLADSKDIILLHEDIDELYLEYLSSSIDLPKLHNISEMDLLPKNVNIVPFINTGNIHNNNFKKISTDPNLVLKYNDKLYVKKMILENDIATPEGKICNSIKELINAYISLKKDYKKVVIKSSYGSSAKGLRIINSDKEFYKFIDFLKRRNGEQIYLLIEGWIEQANSINTQMIIEESGPRIINISEQIIDDQGVYKGTNYITSYDHTFLEKYEREIKAIGGLLFNQDYRGVLGIDSIIQGENLYPLIEINARFTQVMYLSKFVDKLIEKNGSNKVTSYYRTIKLPKEICFTDFKNILDVILIPDSSNNYHIYTYGKTNILNYGYTYRIYILFYGSDVTKVEDMINKFIHIDFEGVY